MFLKTHECDVLICYGLFTVANCDTQVSLAEEYMLPLYTIPIHLTLGSEFTTVAMQTLQFICLRDLR
jgi:hypothetical protein